MEPPIGIRTSDRHINAAERIHDAAEAAEVNHCHMVNAEAKIVGNRISK